MASFWPHYSQWNIIIDCNNGSRKSSGFIQIPLKLITQDFHEFQEYGQNSYYCSHKSTVLVVKFNHFKMLCYVTSMIYYYDLQPQKVVSAEETLPV